ncbi:MAG: hydrolase, partial [Bacteroides sp.]|nr:hydrolase [Bacteroides sp.]
MMKTKFIFLLMWLSAVMQAQIVYHNAEKFPLLGRATDNVKVRYQRLPDSLENVARKELWDLGKNSAGMA